jgi:hypothetical protein
VDNEREGSGKGAGRERVRASGWAGADRETGGPGRQQGWFPTDATVPGPGIATGSGRGGPSERSNRGEGKAEGGTQVGRAGLMIKFGFPRAQPPPERRRRWTRRRFRIIAIKGAGTQNSGARGPAGYKDEYG